MGPEPSRPAFSRRTRVKAECREKDGVSNCDQTLQRLTANLLIEYGEYPGVREVLEWGRPE